MPTYVYETIPSYPDLAPTRFQLRQGMNDAPLTAHPETGDPVRRVISGGLGFLVGGAPTSPAVASAAPSRSADNCGFACDCGY
jgi:hypothetical protein